ncbi:DUF2141 domain-containing protein [Alteraurantiacibacter palmitatis]|uniref:DUF2141 domain-containing protein n=1 Tax=Alteraurantiacibacter palmitatis TaxID=2054628 RepID=A0ABV7E772_9SPHN
MRHRSRPFAPLALAALVAAGLPGPASSVEVTTRVSVAVTDLRNGQGLVQACLTAFPQHFPDCRDDPQSHRLTVPARANLVLEFDRVSPGTYAVSLLHDENSNGRADRMLMIPREGFGFSRDAPVRMGPPGFDQASFPVGTSPVQKTVRMRYML